MILRISVILLIALTLISCGGYDNENNPLSVEEVQMSDLATELKSEALALQSSAPETLREPVDAFAEASSRFQNLSLRFSSNSLEARKAFDRVMFYESQITQSEKLASVPEFQTKWNELRVGKLREIAEKLGYRPEKLEN